MSDSTLHMLGGMLIAALLLGVLVLGWVYEAHAWFTLSRWLWTTSRRWITGKSPGEQA